MNTTKTEMEQINRFARKELTPQEVYTFKVTLCDNDIDRDYERFTDSALEKLAEMFIGKTGIYDHNPSGRNQWARIYDTQVVAEEGRYTQDKKPYRSLQAKAYMVRTAANEDLIAEIEAGIKKEVSVGCSVRRKRCSICGADRLQEGCTHQQGEYYEGKLCHLDLEEPQDAYEFSFVAVPAQPAAGITKQFADSRKREEKSPQQVLEKLFSHRALTQEEKQEAQKAFAHIKAMSLLGEEYLACKRQELLRTAALCRFPMEQKELDGISKRLTAQQLDSLAQSIKEVGTKPVVTRQLASVQETVQGEGLSAFRL